MMEDLLSASQEILHSTVQEAPTQHLAEESVPPHLSASFATTQYMPKKLKTTGDSGGEFRYTNHYEDKKIGTYSG